MYPVSCVCLCVYCILCRRRGKAEIYDPDIVCAATEVYIHIAKYFVTASDNNSESQQKQTVLLTMMAYLMSTVDLVLSILIL